MRIWFNLLLLSLMLVMPASAQNNPPLRVVEADGSPNCNTNKIIVSNNSLTSCAGNVATVAITSSTSSYNIVGTEAGDAVLNLSADEADDAADTWKLTSAASDGELDITSNNDVIASFSTTGFLTDPSDAPYVKFNTLLASDSEYSIGVDGDGGNDDDDPWSIVDDDLFTAGVHLLDIYPSGSIIMPVDSSTFTVGSKSTTGDPSGAEGMFYYNAFSDKFRCYENGAWTNCVSGATGLWSGLGTPIANLALDMTSYTTSMTWGVSTSTNDLLRLTNTASSTGTGFMLEVETQTGSTVKPLHVVSAGVEAITVLANGNVGIGTSAPGGKAVVASSNAAAGVNLSVNNIYAAAGARTEKAELILQTGGLGMGMVRGQKELDFMTNAKEDGQIVLRPYLNGTGFDGLLIASTGNIGIGTTGTDPQLPSFKLSFNGDDARTIGMERETANNANGNDLTIRAGGSTIFGWIASLSATPTAGGSAYTLGDVLTIGGTGTGGEAYVTGVSSGVVTAVVIYKRGAGYSVASGVATTGGTGTGCTLDILTVRSSTDDIGGELILQSGIGTGTGNSGIVFQTNPAGSTGTTDTTPTTYFKMDGKGHLISFGTAPVLSSCGTTPAIAGTDTAGKITIGTGSTTSCTATFNKTFTNAPACTVSGNNTAVVYIATTSTTVLTLTSSADMDSDVLSYICLGRE